MIKKPTKKGEPVSVTTALAVGSAVATAPLRGNAALMERLVKTLAAEKEFTPGTVVKGSSPTVKLLGVVPTGSPTLDAAIGRGGYPFSRITVLSGSESTGKTTHLLHAIRNAQEMGGIGVYMDLENKLDLDYAAALGVNVDAMAVVRPGFAERAFSIAHKFIANVPPGDDVPIVIALDSINACVPKSEFESEDYEANAGGMGAQARLFSSGISKMVQLLGGRRIVFLAVSQPRDKLSRAGSWKEKITGGSAWKFYAALAIDLKKDKEADVKVDGKEAGHGIIAEVIKNQVARPFKTASYNIVWGAGIDYDHALMSQASKLGLMNTGDGKPGGWCDMPDPTVAADQPVKTLKWQGVNGWRRLVAARPELLAYIETEVRNRFK